MFNDPSKLGLRADLDFNSDLVKPLIALADQWLFVVQKLNEKFRYEAFKNLDFDIEEWDDLTGAPIGYKFQIGLGVESPLSEDMPRFEIALDLRRHPFFISVAQSDKNSLMKEAVFAGDLHSETQRVLECLKGWIAKHAVDRTIDLSGQRGQDDHSQLFDKIVAESQMSGDVAGGLECFLAAKKNMQDFLTSLAAKLAPEGPKGQD
jgi:hypothetical protein